MQNKIFFIDRKKILRILCVCATCLYVIFIFSNSLDSAARSSEKSGAVTAVLQAILNVFLPDAIVSESFVRTAAHFAEFAVLGLLLIVCIRIYTAKYIHNIFIALFTSLAVAVTDELIQLFSPGRACELIDVVVDFSGAVSGMFVCIIIIYLAGKIKRSVDLNGRRNKGTGKKG